MELMHNMTFRVSSSDDPNIRVTPGIYRVILDEPSCDLTCTTLIYPDVPSPENSVGRKKKSDSQLRHPRKRAPMRHVGKLVWLGRAHLEKLSDKKLLYPVSVERRFVPEHASEEMKQHSDRINQTNQEHAARVCKMALFFDFAQLQESILLTKGIGLLVKRTMQEFGVSRSYVYKHWSSLCLWGFHESSLLPRRDRCGAPGISRHCNPPKHGEVSRQKAGRKTTKQRIALSHGQALDPEQPGMSLDWATRIRVADRQLPTPKPPIPKRIQHVLSSSFLQTLREANGAVEFVLGPEGSYPNKNQIRRVLTRDLTRLERMIEKTTKQHFSSQLRGLRARNWKGVAGPGHTWAIDSTVGDIYLRSSVNRAWIIGRPIVYIIVDVWSTAIVGFHVCLSGPSWDTAKLAIFNACAGPSLWQQIHGFVPFALLNPYPTLCYRLLCDRGEYLSQGHSKTSIKLDYQAAFTPPYRGDLKGLVEVTFRIIKDEQFWFIPGAIDYRREELELRRVDPRKCTYTLQDYVRHLAEVFSQYNFFADRSKRITGEMRAVGVFPSPAGLWRWGHLVGSGYQKLVHEDDLIRELLRKDDARVKSDGVWHAQCMYTSEHVLASDWSARARNFGGWTIPVFHHPSSMGTIWTPSAEDQKILPLSLTTESNASRHYSIDEWSDVLALNVMARPGEDHARLAASVQSLRRLQAIKDNAELLTKQALEQSTGRIPSMTEARLMESAAANFSPSTETDPQNCDKDEAQSLHDVMMAELLQDAGEAEL